MMAGPSGPAFPLEKSMANKNDSAVAADEPVEARVLVDGAYGKINDVVEIPAESIDSAVAAGEIDTHPDAVAYAKTLKAS